MLVDPFCVPSSAQFNADTAVYENVGCSRKPKICMNGYDIIIAMQKWQLERGYFLQKLDGNNCGPIACMKIMELFHAIDAEEIRVLNLRLTLMLMNRLIANYETVYSSNG